MNFKTIPFEKLATIYSLVSELCSEYAVMTDKYALASGDSLFKHTPNDISEMISERQEFFKYKGKLKEVIKERIRSEMKSAKDED